MVVLNEKAVCPENEKEILEDVETSLIKDSVLELTDSNYAIIGEDEILQMGSIRKNLTSFIEGNQNCKSTTREKYFKEDWSPEREHHSNDEIISDLDDGSEGGHESKSKSDLSLSKSDQSPSESEIEDDMPEEDAKEQNDPVRKLKRPHEISIYSTSARDVTSDIERGNAIKNQLCVWDNLLECRIKLQKALVACNKLYQRENFENLKNNLNAEEEQIAHNASTDLTEQLDLFLELEKLILSKHSELEFVEEEEPMVKKGKTLDYNNILNELSRSLKTYRDPIIQKWNDKTRVLSGRISSSDFSAFDQSTLKQIEQILCDKTRLVRRTQLKRSTYHILGKESDQEILNKDLEEYDTEIFDDDDFYHKLLRDFIEKTSDATDPHQLGREWTKLQKLRSKMKRKVDTKATKGRKLRYTVHNKLVNFMAPIPYSTWANKAETELYKSLFGNASLKI